MARPTTKEDLLFALHEQYAKLYATIEKLGQENFEKEFLFEDRDRNLRDVLAHLHEWHKMVILWHKEGTLKGGTPAVPGVGYTWRTIPTLNMEIWHSYQNVALEEIMECLTKTHQEIVDIVADHTNDELFAKGVYPWTKSSTLGAYFVSSGPSHYEWAMKKIRKQIKLLG